MSRFLFAAWVGLVAFACTARGGEPMYMPAPHSTMQLASLGGGYGCGCDGRVTCGMHMRMQTQMPCGCERCRCYDLCCPRLLPSIINKLDCMLQWVFCDPCNMPCMRPVRYQRGPCCGDAWYGYAPRCGGFGPRCGFEPRGGFDGGCGGGNWSPVTPADPFRDDELKTPPPTPAAERSTHTSNMSIYARPHITAYRSKHEPKTTDEVDETADAETSLEVEAAYEAETEVAVDEGEESMVRHASAERKVSEERKSPKKAKSTKQVASAESKATKQVSSTESKSSSFPRNPLRDEN